MRRLLQGCCAAFLLSAGATFAADAVWTSATVPQSVEVQSSYTLSKTESSPVLIVYLQGNPYFAYYTNDKAKAWHAMIQSAIASGKNIAVYWDPDYQPQISLCDGFLSTGACQSLVTGSANMIQRISLQ